MIVQCDSCQTRFRLPDSAVGERGAKARCSRCGNVFVVERPPEPETAHVTMPPPAHYSGLAVASAALPQVAAASTEARGFALEPDSPPTTRTELPSFTSARPEPRPPPPAPAALGAFAPSSGGRSAFASLPPPPTAPETSSPELSSEHFFDIPPPLSDPPEAPEVPSFDGPAFGRTAEVSKFSRASHVSFGPLDLNSGPPPPKAAPPPRIFRDEVPSIPSLVGPADGMSWNAHDEETRRVEPSELPELDRLPDAPPPPAWQHLRETAERDPFELQSALEQGRAQVSSPPEAAPSRARAATAGPTRRLAIGEMDIVAKKATSDAPSHLEPVPARELPAWSVEALGLFLALLVASPLLLALEDESSPLRPVIAFLSSTPQRIDPAALTDVRAEGVRVQAAVGAEAGVVVHGLLQNPGGRDLSGAEVLVHALDGDRLVKTQRQALAAAPRLDKPSEFSVVFPGTAAEYRPLRFRVEVAPARPASLEPSERKNP